MDEEESQVEVADTYPLLMEHHQTSSSSSVAAAEGAADHVVLEVMTTPSSSSTPTSGTATDLTTVTQAASSSSTSSSTSSANHGNTNGSNYGNPARPRVSPLNSGLWISIELTITVSQIVASIIVLSLSRDEKPQAPLSVWVAGYAAGCLATLPLLYWRYTHRNPVQDSDQRDSTAQSTPSTTSLPSSPRGTAPYVALTRPADIEAPPPRTGDDTHTVVRRRGIDKVVEKFKIALDCFFAVWFVVGNVWIFGSHSSSREAPNLYRLCIVFLTFSCIGYAMPFILCATICCCLPCIITLLGFREEQTQNRGAPPEVIAALPTYKFKSKSSKEGKDGNESDSDGSTEGGLVGVGTDKERAVSGDDAVCCICLARYKDADPLRELSCSHHFHVDCVDKWLKINASCPLCKLDVVSADQSSGNTSASAAAAPPVAAAAAAAPAGD